MGYGTILHPGSFDSKKELGRVADEQWRTLLAENKQEVEHYDI
jgi:hypothetical protein